MSTPDDLWTPNEKKLFDRATFLISTGDFSKGLGVARKLEALVAHDNVKTAYVLGCKIAVALRHVRHEGHLENAEQAFRTAFKLALEANAFVIAAYILNDWSSMYKGERAIEMVQEAIELCDKGNRSPDPERHLEPDKAYFRATLARYLGRNQQYERAFAMLTRAQRILRQFAYGSHPRYKHAYLLVLRWERELTIKRYARRSRRLSINLRVAKEMMRQGKIIATLKVWVSRRLRQQLYPKHQS